MDVYLAGKCDFFVGDGASNVSCAISHFKKWDDDKIKVAWTKHTYVNYRKISFRKLPSREFLLKFMRIAQASGSLRMLARGLARSLENAYLEMFERWLDEKN